MTTPIAEITEISGSQINQYATANEAFRALESLVQNFVELDFAEGDIVIDELVFMRHFMLRTTNNTVARALELPGKIRFFAVLNQGSEPLTITQGATDLTLAAGSSAFYFTDGTENGLIKIG